MRIGKLLLIILIPVIAILAALLGYAWFSLQDQIDDMAGGPTPGQVTDESSQNTIAVTPDAACVPINGTQQFAASAEGVEWSVSSLGQNSAIGTIDANGLFTAAGEIGWGEVIGTKENAYGSARVVVAQSAEFCESNSAYFIPSDTGNGGGGNGTGISGQGVDKKPSVTATGQTKWAASFDIELKYEVIGQGLAGYVTQQLVGGFWFFVDPESGKLTLPAKSPGMVNINTADDVVECDVTTLNDAGMMVSGTDGKIVDGELVLGQNFVIVDYKEGLKWSCINDVIFSEPEVSAIEMIGQNAFPISVDFSDNATAPIHATFDISGRQAVVEGSVTLKKTGR